ncbi:MAG TPA: group III truncated hemoglobin [Chitinophagaceae bacterium]|nr:group III truncated hemoglobin [Chitinophagaceae bacterium]
MKDIQNRSDIELLVNTFYDRIRADDLLGPIFNYHLKPEDWPPHLIKLADFWETNLFGIRKFKGSPTAKHIIVDEHLDYKMDVKHFGIWLQIWFSTIDSLFEGHLANRAKEAARRMAHGQFMMVFHHRPEEVKTAQRKAIEEKNK